MSQGDEQMQSERVPLLSGTGVRFAIFTCAIILFVGMLYIARDLLLPLTLAFLVALTLSPIVRAGRKRGVPPFATAAVLVLTLTLTIVVGLGLLTRPVTNWIQEAPRISYELRSKLYELRQSVEQVSQASKEVEKLTESAKDPEVQRVSVEQPGFLPSAADDLVAVLSMLLLTAILILFLLGSSEMIYEKIVRVLPTMTDKKRALRLIFDIERTVSRYLLSITLINVGLGFFVGSAMWLLGVPSPVLWGVAAATLNFLPYVGNLIGIALVAMVSLVSFPTLTEALLPPLAYLALTSLEGQLVTPLLLGRNLEMNAVAILIALAFWGWLWGLAGMLIAVPLLIVMKAVCEHFEDTRAIAEFLSRGTRPIHHEPDTPLSGPAKAPPQAAD
ncbi:MAG: AI-2E family transporter [Tistlia sp.]|uniref:AI-2E family transporter n=1 Tax=Tistlia sp. TaxID=3057121 RepID=UPI0034A31319